MTISDTVSRLLSRTSAQCSHPDPDAEAHAKARYGWESYPGYLDVDVRYKLLAEIRNRLPDTAKSRRRHGPALPFDLSSHDNKAVRPLDDRDLPLVTQIRNGRRYLPSFLAHYKRLGVTRFIFVDDGSSDGTAEYLAPMSDVDLYRSNISYMESNRGILFKEEIVRRYGKNRWWLFVDIDEYLVFEGAEDRSLRDLIASLERRKIRRLLAPLLDMYPVGDIDQARFDGSDSTMPWEVATAFDRSGYFTRFRGKDWEIRGGMRHRVFGNWLELTKYPLMYVSDRVHFNSIHYPRPAIENCVPILGNLLHFKIFDDYAMSIRKAAKEGRYFGGSKHYRVALDTIARKQPKFFMPDISETFTGPQKLLDMGFFGSSS